MSKMNCLGRIFLLSVMGSLSLLGTTMQSSAQALQCGANITTSTTLTADLGPCPGGGLGIDGATAPVTLNLNGHKISGTGSGVGISVGSVGSGLTIQGPGKIKNFGVGIGLGGVGDVLIYDLVLERNQGGITISQGGTVRVLNNVISGGPQGQTGIFFDEDSGAYIYKNTISGFVTAVEIPYESSAVVDENLITLNQTGIYLPVSAPLGVPAYCIRGNVITFNQETGIQMGSMAGASADALPEMVPAIATNQPCFTVEDNTVTFNGGSGISVTNEVSTSVRDNMVSFNRINGISITGSSSSQVAGNRVQNNGTDLFWDGTGAPCWQQNIFNTDSPATLPPCD